MEFVAQGFDASLAPVAWPTSSEPRWHAGADLRVAVVQTLADLDALGPEWEALVAACGRPHQVFQGFAWLRIWASIYIDRGTRLSVVTGRKHGRLVFVFPLVIERVLGLRVLSCMGAPLSQYGDALVAADCEAADLDAAWAAVRSLRVDIVALRHIRDDAAITPLLCRRLGAAVNRQAAPVVALADITCKAAFEARFPGKLRASRRRRRRRLEERGRVTFDHHEPSQQAAALAATGLVFKRDWARGAGVVAPTLFDPRFERFFAAAALLPASGLRVSALRCADEILGVEISVACNGRLFGHVLAPRPGFGALGLGGLLAESTIMNAHERGYAAVDLLAPADAYKLEWTDASVGVGDYLAPLTLRGSLYARLWLRGGRDAAKRLARRLRPALARLRG